MGLVTKEVEVNPTSKMIKYYENLGYFIPKHKTSTGQLGVPKGTRITVNVNDLPDCSTYPVEIECDKCHKIFNRRWVDYIRNHHIDGTYCHKCAIQTFISGDKSNFWNPNLTDEDRNAQQRISKEYKETIQRVLYRDNFTCQICGQEHGDLAVHHLDGFNCFPEKRNLDSNCITLCWNHHEAFHNKYGRGDNTREQFEEWIGRPVGELGTFDMPLPEPKKVYCFEDDLIFDGTSDAAKYYGCLSGSIYNACSGRSNSSCGKHFMWLEKYKEMDEYDIKRYMDHINSRKKGRASRAVMHLEDGHIYCNVASAANYYNVSMSSIYNNVANKTKYTLVGHFIYVDEFDSLDDCAKAELFEKYHRKGAA